MKKQKLVRAMENEAELNLQSKEEIDILDEEKQDDEKSTSSSDEAEEIYFNQWIFWIKLADNSQIEVTSFRRRG